MISDSGATGPNGIDHQDAEHLTAFPEIPCSSYGPGK
jgi:hypothetical protein